MAECCELGGEARAADFRAAYEDFCRDLGEKPLSAQMLGKRLAQRGFKRGGAGRRSYIGLSLTPRVRASASTFSNSPRVRALGGVTENDGTHGTPREVPTSDRNGGEHQNGPTETIDRMREMGLTPTEDEA